nr:signal recognition particle protein Srp54 [Methanothermus fervidus]
MLGKLGEKLRKSIKKLAKMPIVDEKVVKEVIKDLQRALIQADVNVKLVFKLSKSIEKRALKEEPPKGITPKEHVIKIVYEELTKLLGKKSYKLKIDKKPYKILFVGLQGSGKTTTVAKLAHYLRLKGYNSAVVCTDTWRTAAYDQLKQLTEEINVPMYGDPNEDNPIRLAKEGLNKFKNYDVILFDTAGRHKNEKELLDEMEMLSKEINPDEIILVIDGTIGQQAKSQAKAFSERVKIGSIIVTKLDGSAKGGGALSAVSEVGAPIKFIGTGEKIDDLEEFDPARFMSRLLGMGDIKSLIEKFERVVEEEDKISETVDTMLSGKFTLKDLKTQFETMKKMGPLKQILNMLPLAGNIPKNFSKITEDKIKKYCVIMDSMTEEELENPRIIKYSRVKRIARGAGVRNEDVRELLRYYKTTKKALKGFERRKLGGPIQSILKQIMR